MAKPRVQRSGVQMPEELHWRNAAAFISDQGPIPSWVDVRSATAVFGFRKFQARRELRKARAVFLAGLREKPEGISDTEFLFAHGLTREALGTSVARSLGL